VAITRESTTAAARESVVFIIFLGNAALKKKAPQTGGREREWDETVANTSICHDGFSYAPKN
jgi:hypothetical protein